ncbi:MAG: phenylalanine--tRNA ligase beta subunit-related protein [Candidatus Nezhaarchaeota archaeon]|nr:phenylalanine--tRNA ligase beta subunit-related protein [Candidatus Nezhaarchaeota archaeon]MCX8141322.1 phenylalanine--tRNA ligase beta subunit-related protein [Candidatus Nezhaarchaeota archaeon]MDW8049588.1 phenylalanine--tRNA ligase beta subunit-related protein [Nitrososphaerota archaeon]
MINIAEELTSLGVFLRWRVLEGVMVYKSSSSEVVMNIIRESVNRVRSTLTLETLKDHPVIRAYRDFYWRLGIDPTKTRPSAEALIRRVLRHGDLPLINNVVDLGNVASIETMIPIGIYDLDQVIPPLTLRRSRRGEVFHPIGGKPEFLTQNEIVLSDLVGRIVHVFPHRDSVLTMVREVTKNILIVACGVRGVEESRVQGAVDMAFKLIMMSLQSQLS